MGILPIKSSLDVKSISYYEETCEVVYVFQVNAIDFSLKGKLFKGGDIKGVEYSEELEGFLVNVMPVDRGVSKKLSSITWRYVEGESIEFPFSLICR